MSRTAAKARCKACHSWLAVVDTSPLRIRVRRPGVKSETLRGDLNEITAIVATCRCGTRNIIRAEDEAHR